MNVIEKTVYDLVKSNPNLKHKIRNLYQDIFSTLKKPKEIIHGELICKEGYFFGFHDVTPFSFDDKFVLANKIVIPHRMPVKDDKLGIGFFYGENYEQYKLIDYSIAWNWHKGCRLQWINQGDQFIYNSFDKALNSRIADINGIQLDTFDFPIDTIGIKNKIAATFDYHRLEYLMPGYGYRSYSKDYSLKEKAPTDNGAYVIDLQSKTIKLLISLKELANSWSDVKQHDLYHFVTHTLFSPDNRYLAFLHRAAHPDNLFARKSRLVVYDFLEHTFYYSPTSGMVSHYNFDNKNRIIAYCQINGKDGHYLFDDPKFTNYEQIKQERLNSDGHQYFSSINDKVFITDTYPDRYRYSKLYKVDIDNNDLVLKLYLKSPRKFRPPNILKHWSCDLHPRMANKSDIVCFDSTHTGQRALCFLK